MEHGREIQDDLSSVIGRGIQEGWRAESLKLPNCPPSWCRSYDEVSQEMRDKNDRMGSFVAKELMRFMDENPQITAGELVSKLRETAERG